MSSVLTTFADSEIFTRWQTPYVSDSLNARLAGVLAPGVYRGFKLTDCPTKPMTVVLVADVSTKDHVAVYESALGYGLTLRRMGGNFELNLASLPNTTAYITITASYADDQPTTGSIIAYTSAEWNALGAGAKRAIVILGIVQVPASGVIPATAIDLAPRKMAWQQVASEALPWTPLLRNAGFEAGPSTGALGKFSAAYWEVSASSGAPWTLRTTDPKTGKKHLEYVHGGIATAALKQSVMLPVNPGQLVRASIQFKALQTISGGSLSLAVQYGDETGADVAMSAYAITTPSADSSYRAIEKVFVTPTGAYFLKSMQLLGTALNFPSAAAAFRVDEFQAWIEISSALSPHRSDQASSRQVVARPFVLEDVLGVVGDLAAVFNFDKSATPAGQVSLERRDGATNVPSPTLALAQMVLGHGIPSSPANALLARLSVAPDPALPYTLVAEMTGAAGAARLYATTDGTLVLTSNAKFQADGNWTKDLAGTYAASVRFEPGAARVRLREATVAGTWADSAWLPLFDVDSTTLATTVAGGSLRLVGTEGQLTLSGSSGPATLTRNQLAELLTLRSGGDAGALHTHTADHVTIQPISTDSGEDTVQKALVGLQGRLAAHVNKPTDAHAGAAISLVQQNGIQAANLQLELESIRGVLSGTVDAGDLTAHITQQTGAHQASAVSTDPIVGLEGTLGNVQSVLGAIQGEINALNAGGGAVQQHIDDPENAHAAWAIWLSPISGFEKPSGDHAPAVDVQAGLESAKWRIDTHQHTGTYSPSTHDHASLYAPATHFHKLTPTIAAAGFMNSAGVYAATSACGQYGVDAEGNALKWSFGTTGSLTGGRYQINLTQSPTQAGYWYYALFAMACSYEDRVCTVHERTTTGGKIQIRDTGGVNRDCDFYFIIYAY